MRGEQRAAADDARVLLPRVLHGAALLTREADRRLPSLPLLPHEQDLLEEGVLMVARRSQASMMRIRSRVSTLSSFLTLY